jgi:Fe-S cluster assembly protein SufD
MTATSAASPTEALRQTLLSALPSGGLPDWAGREPARSRLATLPVPTPREEGWRFTPLASAMPTEIGSSPTHLPPTTSQSLGLLPLIHVAPRIFISGGWPVEMPAADNCPPGLTVRSLATLVSRGETPSELGTAVAAGDSFFACVNDAAWADGVVIRVRKNTRVEMPVMITFANPGKTPRLSTPRVLVVLESGAALTLVEDHQALGSSEGVTVTTTEILLGEGSRLEHVRIQREGARAVHLGNLGVRVEHDAHYGHTSIALGARLSRVEQHVEQAGTGTSVRLDALAMVGDEQVSDLHTTLWQRHPHGVAAQRHKAIVGGTGRAVFNGRVRVEREAQQTRSDQVSRSLLLSPRARVHAQPQLEIFADDVRCTHGATVGQLDDEELFYLRSRGLDVTTARRLLIGAFAAEILREVPLRELVETLEGEIVGRIQSGQEG